ncbi:alpha/beta hydrolase [Rhodospirillaceae bacterium SYSU D60014]|uniref:alpha/beta hydrolase n=1 Tax=Virgifigura deserti TaxID=2268457 RepID=UPI0013C47E22
MIERRTSIPLLRLLILALVSGSVAFVATSLWMGTRLAAPAPSSAGLPPPELAASDVRFENAYGETLSGWWIEAKPACGTILLMHGIRQNRRAMLSHAPFLVEAGYAVLLFDFRAHGESEGDRITFGHRESGDARAAISFAARQLPGRPVAAIGFSMGGAAALLADPPLDLDALVVEAAYPTWTESVVNKIRIRLGPLAELVAPALLLQLEPRLGISPDALRPINRITGIDTPVLVIAGTDDPHAPLAQSRALYEVARPPKAFWAVEGAGHVDFHRAAPAEYERRVLEFLKRHLGPCPPPTGS